MSTRSRIKIVFLILISYFSSRANVPVNFLPEKNNLQILPQKFEYNLVSNSSIQLGDILIDSNNLSLDMDGGQKNPQLIFTWPAGLIKNANLILFNHFGKAIAKFVVSKENIELLEGEKKDPSDLLRREKALFRTKLTKEIFEEIKYLPFFKFCLQKKEPSIRIELCSIEHFFTTTDGQNDIKSRVDQKSSAQIFINNIQVGDQGVIFLNDAKESINFRAQSQSGAKLEIETRMKPIDFRDLTSSPDGKILYIVGKGSNPVSDNNVTQLNNDLWKIALPSDFPVFYVEGEGGIPFRQEFYVKGIIPKESQRIYAFNKIDKTYDSSVDIALEPPKNAKIYSKDSNSLANTSHNKIDWTLTGLKKNKLNVRQLTAKYNTNDFVIYHDITRGAAWESRFGVDSLPSSSLALANASISYWLNNLRSGLNFNIATAVAKPNYLTQFSDIELTYWHRLTPGLNQMDHGWQIGAIAGQLSFGDIAFTQVGFSTKYSYASDVSWSSLFTKTNEFLLSVYLPNESSGVKLNSHTYFHWLGFLNLNSTSKIYFGPTLQYYGIDSNSDFKSFQPGLKLGASLFL